MNTIRVALVEDQAMVRTGLRMVIESQPDMSVELEAGNGEGLTARLSVTPVDIVLMDLQMPSVDGITATRSLMELPEPPRVVVLTTFATDDALLGAIRAGASGFMLKDADPEELLTCIRTVHAGDSVISPRMTTRLLAQMSREPVPGPDVEPSELPADLTPREIDVLRLVTRGMSNQEIAAELTISETTVKTHLGHLITKTGSRDRIHLAILGFRCGLLD